MNDIPGLVADQRDEPVRARLKWFNAPKGFGFVVPDGDNIDAFLHVTTLQKAGFNTLGEGAVIICCIERGPKGALVTEVLAVLNQNTHAIDDRADEARPAETVMDGEITGQIKWYSAEKGFGFIIPDNGNPDVFTHQVCLDQLHLKSLDAGQQVAIKTRVAAKGSEAVSIRLIGQ